MKRMGIISMIAALLIVLMTGASCAKTEEKESSVSEADMRDFIVSYAEQYTALEESDGSYTVTVTAPDFSYYLYSSVEENSEKVDYQKMKNSVLNDKNLHSREYSFQVEKTEETVIENAFLDKVCYDIVIDGITAIE